MGTRNLICAVIDGEYKVAQYCQWDGYPEGQGLDILKFFRDTPNLGIFRDKLKKCAWLDAKTVEEYNARLEEEDKEVGDLYPHLSRDAGSKIFGMIQDSDSGLSLKDQRSFAADSLFCEWAYVVDFDKGLLECFEGFQKEPLEEGERFIGATCDDGNKEYHPVKLVCSFPLDNLPDNEKFLASFSNGDEEG